MLKRFLAAPRAQATPARERATHLALGEDGETAAAGLLARQGMRILARNWRHGRFELDIVASDGDTIVFVEVKTRASARFGGPAAALGRAKQAALCRAARAWLAAHQAWERPCRFDVVCLVRDNAAGTFSVEHYRHAFSFTNAAHCGNAPWQPW